MPSASRWNSPPHESVEINSSGIQASGMKGNAKGVTKNAEPTCGFIPHCGILWGWLRRPELRPYSPLQRRASANQRGGRAAAFHKDQQTATATTFWADLIEDLKQVLEHQRGKIGLEQVWPRPVDVKAIRQRVKMSQAEFSRAYGISIRALQEWEQGGRRPDSTARAYLTVIAKEPAVVRRALARE
jgi:putative transcriptional regulator